MKKALTFALLLSSTLLLACPMQEGKCGGGCKGLTEKCGCDTSKLPSHLENLGLSDKQKAEVQKIREETKTFRNKQHDKMMAVLTPDQRAKLEENKKMQVPAPCPKGDMKMPEGGMGCKNCDKK